MHDGSGSGLERSCTSDSQDLTPGGWIRNGAPGRIERIEAYFSGHAYDPHRHDTYAVGFTLNGVQRFDYRGQTTTSLTGDTIVIHPDELHDGRAGDTNGFRYRMAYVEPALLRAAMPDPTAPLPFATDAVMADPRLMRALCLALDDLDMPMEDLQEQQLLTDLADALTGRDPSQPVRRRTKPCLRSVERARALLDEMAGKTVHSEALEGETGLDRFTLSRQFRAVFGTSPYRYLTMRRLDQARRAIRRGASLAEAACEAGFADQSHMTRQFRKAYGLSPGLWRTLQSRGRKICETQS